MNAIWFILGSAVSGLAGYLVLRYADELKLVHTPNTRSSHSDVVPHGGGVGIALAFLLFAAVTYQKSPMNQFVLLGGGLAISAVSLWDDLYDVSVIKRLGIHMAVAMFAVAAASNFSDLSVGSMLLFCSVTVGLVWWINAYNFMDGVDAIASVEGFCIASSFLLLALVQELSGNPSNLDWYISSNIVVAGSVIAFLVFNFPPAKIFMGDVGSAFLGFATGFLALLGWKLGIAPIWSFLILGGVFFVDATYTLARRVVQREKFWQPHNSHAYQCLSRRLAQGRGRTYAHRVVALGTAAINLFWLLPLALAAQAFPDYALFILVISWAPLLMLATYWSRPNFLLSR